MGEGSEDFTAREDPSLFVDGQVGCRSETVHCVLELLGIWLGGNQGSRMQPVPESLNFAC